MRRRDVVRLAAAAAALPATRPWELRAQPTRIRLIGFLGATSYPAVSGTLLPALRRGLAQTGFSEGRNVAIEYVRAEGRYERLPALAAGLVARPLDVIIAAGGTVAALAARRCG